MPWWWVACSLVPSIDDEQRQHAESKLQEAEAAREAALAARSAALVGAADVAPGTAPCPIQVPIPSMESGSTSSMEEALQRLAGAKLMAERLVQVPSVEALATAPAPGLERLEQRMSAVREVLDDPWSSAAADPGAQLVRDADALLPVGWDVVLITRLTAAPIAVGEGSFAPGSTTGRVLVWDYDRGRVACVADAVASSSGTVQVVRTEIGGVPISSTPLTDATALHQDLVVNLLRAAIPELRAVP